MIALYIIGVWVLALNYRSSEAERLLRARLVVAVIFLILAELWRYFLP